MNRLKITLLKKICSRINQWLFLERLFLLLIGCLIIYLAFYFASIFPIQKTQDRLNMKIQMARQQLILSEGKAKMIAKQSILTVETSEKQYQQLLQATKQWDEKINQSGKKFETIDHTTSALRNQLAKYSGLRLKNITTSPIQVVFKLRGDTSQLSTQAITFVIQGKYLDVQSYLEDLEQLKIQLFWDHLEYNIVKYPEAEVTITVFILHPPQKFRNEQ